MNYAISFIVAILLTSLSYFFGSHLYNYLFLSDNWRICSYAHSEQ